MLYEYAVTKNSRHFLFVAMFLFAQLGHTQQQTQVVPPDFEIPATSNVDDLIKDLNLKQFKGKTFNRKIKVAVLDNGFGGRDKEIGKTLPKDTVYDSGPVVEIEGKDGKKIKVVPSESHGSVMARLLMMVLDKSGAKYDIELHLIDALGYTRFSAAVEKVIREKFDVVLYSQVWEFGGNVDGKGFINVLVDKAVAAGVIWIQAAGNFNLMTRLNAVDGKVEGKDEWVVFTHKGKTSKGVNISCDLPKGAKCPLRMILNWNSYKDDTTTGTDKDLDLFVYDRSGKVVASSTREQILVAEKRENTTLLPREMIENVQLDPGQYMARVKVRSKNFSASQDQIRLLIRPPFTMQDPTPNETLLAPADNEGVIVIGASDEPHTGVSKLQGRPHVLLKSLVKLKADKDEIAFAGSSSAAAIGAGLAVLYLGTGTEQSRRPMIDALKTVSAKRSPVPLPTAPGERTKTVPPPPTSKSPSSTAPHTPAQPRTTAPRQSPQQQTQQQYPPQVQGGYSPPPTMGMPQPMPMPMPAPVPVPVPVPVPPPPPPPQRYCLVARPVPVPYPAVQQLLMNGRSASVDVGGGRVGILTSYDFVAAYGLRPPGPGEKIFMTPRGPIVAAPQMIPGGVPYNFYEIVRAQIPICATR